MTAVSPENSDIILTQKELAERLSVTQDTLRRWAKYDGLPRLNTPGAVRYSWSQVYSWLNEGDGNGKLDQTRS